MVKLFVGSILPTKVRDHELRKEFEKYGRVKEACVLKNYGFVHMAHREDADRAIKYLNRKTLNGCQMAVMYSETNDYGKRDRISGGSRGGGGRYEESGRGGRHRESPRSRSRSRNRRRRSDSYQRQVSRPQRRSRTRSRSVPQQVRRKSRSRSPSPRQTTKDFARRYTSGRSRSISPPAHSGPKSEYKLEPVSRSPSPSPRERNHRR